MLEYLANGGNGTQAYRSAYPKAQDNTAATEAWRLLRKPEIRAAIHAGRTETFKRLEMTGDEAVALLSLRARADIAEAFDETGKLLPIQEWPESLRLCVRGIKANGDIVLHDGLKAAELMAVIQGRLRASAVQLNVDHLTLLAGTDTPPEPAPK